MKKVNLLLLVLLMASFCIQLDAQRRFHGEIHEIKQKRERKMYTGMEEFTQPVQPSIHQLMYEQYTGNNVPTEAVDQETWIGFSSYDLQTNGSPKKRVDTDANGRISASWTYHPETSDPATTFPNRGTGYNLFNSGSWGGFPTARLEATTRTGWPNNAIMDSGREVVVCHAFTTEGYVVVLTRDPGETNFTETALPTDVTTTDMLWPHITVSGNTLHVVAIARPGAEGGIHEGLDGAVLYYRSPDGGDTWDVQDYLVPGIDSSFFVGHGVDAYPITSKGDDVAFAIFNGFADVVVLHSDNNGEPGSWTKRIVHDFPLDKYVADTGYSIDDIGGADPDGPSTDSLAIESSDGSGGIEIDSEGRVHVVYGRTYVSDADLTNGGTVFYPGFSGLFYWNSDMPDDGATLIDPVFDALDIDGNDTIASADDLAFYGGGLTSMADLVVTDAGCIIISYAQHMENYVREAVVGSANFTESQNYRHIYITTSSDLGSSWTMPYDVTNPEVLFFPALLPQTEAVYPHIYTDGSNTIHMTYQMDEEPGIFVYNANDGANDPVTSNTIAHWSFDATEFCGLVSTEEVVDNNVFDFSINPNPAYERVLIEYNLPIASPTQVRVANMMGQAVKTYDYGTQAAGDHQLNLDVSQLAAGVYLVSLASDNKLTTKKLIIN